jgi:hypothetical protein
MSGVGKTTAARTLARRYDVRLYSLDSRTYEHAARMPPETLTLDELWVESTPEELADRFEDHARRRFELVLADLEALPADVPVLAEGPQLLPELVDGVFLIALPQLQREIVRSRGSDLYSRTSDPQRALENRLGRDAILAERLRRLGGRLVEIQSIAATLPALERLFAPHLQPAGSGALARRRDENDVRLRQVRAHVEAIDGDPNRTVQCECECGLPGCEQILTLSLVEAERRRRESQPLAAH